jgi:hypothetical protein
MIDFVTLKNGRFTHVQRTGSVETLRAVGALGLLSVFRPAGEPNPGQVGLRYETTKKYDNNVIYDKRFKPAHPSLVCHKGAHHSRKAPLDKEPYAKL